MKQWLALSTYGIVVGLLAGYAPLAAGGIILVTTIIFFGLIISDNREFKKKERR